MESVKYINHQRKINTMQVQTYEIEEIKSSDATTMAADSEAIELINKLGLVGQQELLNPVTATRNPYPLISRVQHLVFTTLFPQHTELVNFRSGIIPLRVLQSISYCKENNLYNYYGIWHTEDVTKDPVLFGSAGRYESKQYLIARWGDALESFEQLQAKAAPLLAAKRKVDLLKIKQDVDMAICTLDEYCDNAVLTGHFTSGYVSL